jgi:hypothetical protein
MAPMPGKVTVCPSSATEASDDDDQGDAKPAAPAVGSLALVDRSEANRNADGSLKNPGYPFWIGGMESSVGPPATPPLDMLDPALARQLKDSGKALWANLDANQVDGWDGGLGRHALDGVSAGGEAVTTTTWTSPRCCTRPSRSTCPKRAPRSNRRPCSSTPRPNTPASPWSRRAGGQGVPHQRRLAHRRRAVLRAVHG